MDMRGIDISDGSLKGVSVYTVFLTNTNLAKANPRDARLENINYDQFTLYSLAKRIFVAPGCLRMAGSRRNINWRFSMIGRTPSWASRLCY
jgi:uncharacterized protein YjbI with pentapeptide repeats